MKPLTPVEAYAVINELSKQALGEKAVTDSRYRRR